MGRTYYRDSAGRRSDSGKGTLFFTARCRFGMALQAAAATILGTVRNQERARRTRSRPTVARLDRGRYLALHPTRTNPDPGAVFRAERQTLSFVRLPAHHAS